MSTAASCLLYWVNTEKEGEEDEAYCAECAREWAEKILAGDA